MTPRPILVAAFGSAGDVQPMAALAQALQRRGHVVTFMTGSLYAPLAQRPGLRFMPIDTQEKGTLTMGRPNAYQALSQIWHRIGQAAELVCALVGEQVRLADAAGRPRPLLVGSSWAVGMRLAQERHALGAVGQDASSMTPTAGQIAHPPPT